MSSAANLSQGNLDVDAWANSYNAKNIADNYSAANEYMQAVSSVPVYARADLMGAAQRTCRPEIIGLRQYNPHRYKWFLLVTMRWGLSFVIAALMAILAARYV